MDNNIVLDICEDSSLASKFEIDIPDDSSVIDVKINNSGADDDVDYWAISKYIEDLGCQILFSSAGVHLLGENKVSHIHYNFITTRVNAPSNPSQHRKRWLLKNEETSSFDNVSFKFHPKIDVKKPKYFILSYPLKEGHRLEPKSFIYKYLGKPMKKNEIDFLSEIGKSIYETECGLNLKRDKCEERKKLALQDLFKICSDNCSNFSTFREMAIWLDSNYIENLPLEDLPDPRNYKTNIQKVAVKLKILKYSDIL